MKIKKCSLDDILDLQKIYQQTFFETFSEQNSEENMRIFLDKAYSEEKLKSEIEDKESETFLAVENQKNSRGSENQHWKCGNGIRLGKFT